MLLSKFRELQELEQRLRELHDERGQSAPSFNPDSQWLQHQYEELFAKWYARGVTIPVFKHLQAKLKLAQDLLLQTAALRPELYGKMAVVLVPPAKLITYSQAGKDSSQSDELLHLNSEFLASPFAKQWKTGKVWRVIIAYAEPEGIYIGRPQQLLNEKRYLLAGYDTYALGPQEYAALVLQESAAGLDSSTWTALLKGCTAKSALVPAAKFDGNRYSFGTEAANSEFGDIRFRPALEVKASRKA